MRPACYLDMTKVEIVSGTGTMEDPYVLNAAAPAAAPAENEPAADDPCCVPGACSCCSGCTCGCQDMN